MTASFIHLRIHTEYSLIDGIVRIKPLVKKIHQLGMPAVAITDHVNLFGTIKFYKACIDAGVKPLIGADVLYPHPKDKAHPFLLTLLCQNEIGYKNLIALISRAYREGQQSGLPLIEKEWLSGYTTGLIALSGGQKGDIGHALMASQSALAQNLTEAWAALFPDRFYLEISRIGDPQEESYIAAVRRLAEMKALPLVATNNVRFLSPEDYEAHEARVCINRGEHLDDTRRLRLYTAQQYLRTQEEMRALFTDIPEALENTVEITKRCNLSLSLGKMILPNFTIPEGRTAEDYLAEAAERGLQKRWETISVYAGETQQPAYESRLKDEIRVISEMGFAGYFLIVADFIQWAKTHEIPVGPGRGSGAGSLVAYALNITDIDPLRYDLLFERFLNPERVSMPDFDIDFCMDNRDRVIEYVAETYGRDNVSQIITYGSMAARAVVRDVGRVLGLPYGFVDKVAKAIPFELGITLDKALEQEEDLRRRYETEEDVKTLIDLAKKLEGIVRNAGKHAGGVVIAPSRLINFTPLYCEPSQSDIVTQYDKDDVETVGLVKFDFLGLRTLTLIDAALKSIHQRRAQKGDPPIDITKIPMDDPDTYALLKSCATSAVFQLESRGMKDLIKRLQPDCFEEIIALVALFRPGPLQSGMVDDFIDRKHKRARVEYLHPRIESVLRSTYGIILYQEQVMQIAQVLAGYTLGGADLLRRAMGKKKPEEMAKQRQIFVTGAKKEGVSTDLAAKIFDLMEKFAGYGFNKSHSAAYALLSYQTAWLKTHYPAEFMAAVLSSDMNHTDKVVSMLEECRNMQLKILPPSINTGHYVFAVNAQAEILYGLGAIKGVGESAIAAIVESRIQKGPFKDLFEFCERMRDTKINRRTLEALISSGAMDGLGPHRAAMMHALPMALAYAEQRSQRQSVGQGLLFADEPETTPWQEIKAVTEWSTPEVLTFEKETLGHYFSGHPLQFFESDLSRLTPVRLGALHPTQNQTILIYGMITSIRTLFNKKNERMAFVTLDDRTGRAELAVFSDVYENCKSFLQKDQIVVVEGEVAIDEFTGGYRISGRQVYDLSSAWEKYAKRLQIQVETPCADEGFISTLVSHFRSAGPGRCPVTVQVLGAGVRARFMLSQRWRVRLTTDLLQLLRAHCGPEKVQVEYEA